MRIYTMTATFGKLEHETLTLQPGLNLITAGNEWGKSTWCAFLTAMLYGLETRAKSTKTSLAEKERYAPWSGSPMGGRIDLNWQGRDITIERSTRGRIPMGVFKAYETASGLEVPELNAHNCGQQLLGVERSVFLRSGFIRLNDLHVTDDEALRRRLNGLVTTGDENGDGDRLASGLKDLKNRIRYNRTGLLPQAQVERDRLEAAFREQEALAEQIIQIQQRLDDLADWQKTLENHRDALRHQYYLQDLKKTEQTQQELQQLLQKLEKLRALCQALPPRDTARDQLAQLDRLEEKRAALWEKLQRLKLTEPRPQEESAFFGTSSPEEALAQAREHGDRYRMLTRKNYPVFFLGLLLLLVGAGLGVWYSLLSGILCGSLGCVVLLVDGFLGLRRIRKAEELARFYGKKDPDKWLRMAQEYAEEQTRRRKENQELDNQRQVLLQQLEALDRELLELTSHQEPELFRQDWEIVAANWEELDQTHQTCLRARNTLETLQSILRPVQPPAAPDHLNNSHAETRELLETCGQQRRQLENRLGQYQGKYQTLEDRETLQQKLEACSQRICRLEKTYRALTIAQETLAEATAELQRRFAPRISRRAGELMARMTQGRYEKLNLDEDLAIRAAAQREDTLHGILWRSDGTVDQLYLSLRLAVSEALLPQAPLILDDALVRFDDARAKAALDILKEEARNRQVILFTCHSREKNLL